MLLAANSWGGVFQKVGRPNLILTLSPMYASFIVTLELHKNSGQRSRNKRAHRGEPGDEAMVDLYYLLLCASATEDVHVCL